MAPGGEVVAGSDVRADVRVAHPLVTRAHLLLRFERGGVVAHPAAALTRRSFAL